MLTTEYNLERIRNYHKLDNIRKNIFFHRYCKKCKCKLCIGIYDEQCGERCSLIDEYTKGVENG
ncbi:MAG: hypothetical protein PHN69_04935 [Candidatus Pacebacteria bacterium]|nr:hypothetical protein [Candidatus Paceibacterota bacterium]